MALKRQFQDDETPVNNGADFEAMLAESFKSSDKKLSVGQRIKSEILSVGKEQVIVSTGSRHDGFVPLAHFKNTDGVVTVKSGDVTDLYVTYVKGSQVFLSPNPTAKNLAEDIQQASRQGLPVEGKVEAVNKGGFEVVVLGQKAFCPMAQMELSRIETPEIYVGKKFEFMVTQAGFGGKNVQLSRRKLLESAQGNAVANFRDQRKVGDIVNGTVKRLEPFGAFIEIAPGLEGLAHISELSWQRVANPSDVLEVGQVVPVKILRMEQEERRLKISLTLKQSENDPWNNLPAQVQVGRVVSGKVSRCMPFGAFVEIAPGIEGLIPLSEFSSTKRATKAEEFVKDGEVIAVLIKEINPQAKRISLSLKGALNEAASASESEDIREYAEVQAKRSLNLSSAGGLMAAKIQAAMDAKKK